MPINTALGRWRREAQKFKVILSHMRRISTDTHYFKLAVIYALLSTYCVVGKALLSL